MYFLQKFIKLDLDLVSWGKLHNLNKGGAGLSDFYWGAPIWAWVNNKIDSHNS